MQIKTYYALLQREERGQIQSCRRLLMRHHINNHCVLVLCVETDPRDVKWYVKAQKTLPELEQQKEEAEGGGSLR